MALLEVSGRVCSGHGVASGRSAGQPHNPYPAGTIAMQMPYFKALGLDVSDVASAGGFKAGRCAAFAIFCAQHPRLTI